MDFKVFISVDALSDLERIVAYIAPRNPIAAEWLGNQLLDAALSLRSLPERGRAVPEIRRPDLREIIFRSYRIIYRPNPADHSLEIVRFWHGARGFPHIPQEGSHGCETKFRSGFGNLHKSAVLYIWLKILAKNYCRQEAGGGG